MSLFRTTPLIALIAVLSLTACETIKGAGRDMQGAGMAVTDTADAAQDDMK
jgi:predicted small secreted protein